MVLPFVHCGNEAKLPQSIWSRVDKIREIALDTMVEIGNHDFSYIFTNQLVENDREDLQIYKKIAHAADKMNAHFMPVRLLCDTTEHKSRIIQPDRIERMKLTRATYANEMKDETVLIPDHCNTLTIDISNMMATEAAARILQKFDVVYK